MSLDEAKAARDILLKQSSAEGPSETYIAALFCLFAADVLRRNHAGGAWSWTTVNSALGPYYDQSVMWRFVEKGLKFWNRPLRENGHGRRFLGSLVLEGGIPAALLGRPDFAHFLRQLQRDLDSYNVSSASDAEMFADRRSTALPQAWRQSDTLALAAEFLVELREWRRLLPPHLTGAASVDYLNARHPNWREKLPLDLADKDAAKLIGSLLAAPRVKAATLRPLTDLVRRVVFRKGEAWHTGLALEEPGFLPGSITAVAPLAGKDPPLRVRFVLESDQAPELAFAEREGEEKWRFQPLRRQPTLLAPDAEAAARLVVDGNELGRVLLPGGAPLSDVPWILEDLEEDALGDEPAQLVHVGYGSRTTSRSRVFIAVEPSTGQLESASGTAREIGPIVGTLRVLFEITGSVVWREHDERSGIRLRTGAKQMGTVALLSIDTRKPNWKILHPCVTIGPPSVGTPSTRAEARIVLRPAQELVAWEAIGRDAWRPGEMDVALIEGDVILDRRRILFLPAATQISAAVRNGRECTVRVSGFPATMVRVDGFPIVIRDTVGDEVSLQMTLEESPPVELTVVTALGVRGSAMEVRHRLPLYLSKGGFAGPDGRMLKGGTLQTFGACGDLTARGGGRLDDSAELAVRLTAPPRGVLADLRLGMGMMFIGEMPLARIKRTLRRLCTTAYSQDAELQLEVLRGGIPGPSLRLAAFAFTVNIDPERRQAYLWSTDGRTLPRLPGQELAALNLLHPSKAARPLLHDGALAWTLPTAKEPGPWLIVGAGSLAGLVRPRVWTTDSSDIAAAGQLAAAVGLPDRSMRAEAFDARLSVLAGDPYATDAEADWSLLDSMLEVAGRVAPALSFELLEAVARVPAILASWMLRADEMRLTRLATLEDDLPIAWSLVPLSSWLQAARAMIRHYAISADPEIVKQLLAFRLSEACSLCPPVAGAAWYVREHLGLPHSPNEPSFEQLKHPHFRAMLRHLVGPPTDEDIWRAEVEAAADWQNLSPETRTGAAVIAARRAVSGQLLPIRLLAAVRFCRHLAEDQFDQRFRVALQSEIAEASSLPELCPNG